ncbi:hypothetical protein E1265_22100 [Streptomyces sp. 8K308]|uniref:ABC transporter substrate-binding protein n=1 Tax=Streptomyces sp. 8K308 TaxID=2530388 RepID=UPI001043BFE6|nr:ABC transporter substrate-binding protein [Streptomyces sp. 8K308]TDC20479.1 hypothetical protein E1265_22100 [Streptomyces sp. 8K308]
MRLRGWGPLTRALAGALALALLALAGWVGYERFWPDASCGRGVSERGPDEECVGVTDGEVVFHPDLDEVSARIKEENDRVTGSDVPYVTVAFILPMTSDDEVERRQTLHEVQGAYLAQYRANHRAQQTRPPIRLVLANPGRNSAQWRPVAEELRRMADSPEDNLRAVVGFDVSTRTTAEAISYLTNEAGIPMVAGPLTADDLGNSEDHIRYPGLARVVPDNSDQAAALASLYSDIDPARTLLVEDLRADDNYIASLRDVFGRVTRDAPNAPEQFVSPPDLTEEGNLPNDFERMVATICTSEAEVIYFAGRNVQLRLFVNALGARGCTEKDYTVITISGASTLRTDPEFEWDALENDVTVRYATIAHPDAWTGRDAPADGGSREALDELLDLMAETGQGDAEQLTDGRAITMYDATLTAITGIRNSTGGEVSVPALEDVANSWLRMHGGGRVEGVSGWICLTNHGDPHNKAVAVVELDPDTEDIRFVGLAWPQGAPPEPDCPLPNPD